MDDLWDFVQPEHIQREASTARADVVEATQREDESTVRPIEDPTTRLALICQAMWTLIQEHTTLTEKDLLQRVTELDLKDGVLDGTYTRSPIKCPRCGAMMSPKFGRCLFCGQKYEAATAFDML